MICTCITARGLEACRRALQSLPMAELRLDKMHLTDAETTQLITSLSLPTVATFRAGNASDTQRCTALKTAMAAGATYIDIEWDAPFRDELIAAARAYPCRTILSHHHFDGTPSREALQELATNMQAFGADYLKIVPFAQSPDDALRVLSLYESTKNLLAFCMGAHGRYSRIASYLLGAPFIYAAADSGATAEGQLTAEQINTLLQWLR